MDINIDAGNDMGVDNNNDKAKTWIWTLIQAYFCKEWLDLEGQKGLCSNFRPEQWLCTIYFNIIL